MHWKTFLILIAGTCFCLSTGVYIFVGLFLRPKPNDDWEREHWDLEDFHPAIRRYYFWRRILFSVVIISMLLLFAVVAV